MTISLYQLKNIILAEQYTKSRKLIKLNSLLSQSEISQDLYNQAKESVLEEETEVTVMSNFESEESEHWIQHYANLTAADLLTLGKVQPETMLAMSLLPTADFEEVVKYATLKANRLNTSTMEVEKRINLNTLPSALT
jgi:hypothetical protein